MSASNKQKSKQHIDGKISCFYRQLQSRPIAKATFRALLSAVSQKSNLLQAKARHYRWAGIEKLLLGLFNISLRQSDFIRPLHLWKPDVGSERKIFNSLLFHIFNHYETPPVMNNIWLEPRWKRNRKYQQWYLALAKGQSLRELETPLEMTKKMVHHFYLAPHHYSMAEAFRHAQVMALGGHQELAKRIVATRIGREHDNGEFWASVIHFFINAKDLELHQVNPIIDFLFSMKFEQCTVSRGDEEVTLPPPHPNLSMKGRSYKSIKKQVNAWHEQLRKRRGPKMSWEQAPLRGFTYLEEVRNRDDELVECLWKIEELLSAKELVAEGRYFHHCVATYSRDCYKGWTTIWSMRRQIEKRVKRIMTIEVDVKGRRIRQARSKYNRMPSKKGMSILNMWASREGLKLGKCL